MKKHDMGRILPVHESHICWPRHHRALILPPVPPLTKKHHQQPPLRAIGDPQRQPPPWSLTGGADPLATRPCFVTAAPSLLPPPPPLPVAAATSTDEGRRGRLRAESQVAEAGFRAPVAGFPPPRHSRPSLQVFFGRHRRLTPDFKARRRLNLPVRSIA
jgi:hypothetical protein